MTAVQDPRLPPAILAPCRLYRVSFRNRDDGLPVLLRLEDPQPALALLAQDEALTEDQPLPDDARAGELMVIFASGGLQTGHAWRQRLESWMAPDPSVQSPILDIPSFSDRVLWRPGRGLIIGSPERSRELLEGLAAFDWYESRLRDLENAVAQAWKPAQRDIELTHQLQPAALSRQTEVNRQVLHTTHWRMTYTRLESHLEKPPQQLPGAVRRLYNELSVQAEAHDRLAALDDRIEVLQDLYELATDRLSEYRYYRGELRVEWLIVAILLIDTGLSLWEFWHR